MKRLRFVASLGAVIIMITGSSFAQDNGIPVDTGKYANRQVLPDFTAAACPDNPSSLTQIKGNLYRHTTGAGYAVHSGLVLITKEGALVIDPGMTCTSGW